MVGPSGMGHPVEPSGDVSDEERELALIEAKRLMELGKVDREEARL